VIVSTVKMRYLDGVFDQYIREMFDESTYETMTFRAIYSQTDKMYVVDTSAVVDTGFSSGRRSSSAGEEGALSMHETIVIQMIEHMKCMRYY